MHPPGSRASRVSGRAGWAALEIKDPSLLLPRRQGVTNEFSNKEKLRTHFLLQVGQVAASAKPPRFETLFVHKMKQLELYTTGD